MALGSAILPDAVRTTGLAILTTATALARFGASLVFGFVWMRIGVDAGRLGVHGGSGGRDRDRPHRVAPNGACQCVMTDVASLCLRSSRCSASASRCSTPSTRLAGPRPSRRPPAFASSRAPRNATRSPVGERVLFRNTALGQGYGQVALARLANAADVRFTTPLVCERVDFAGGAGSCLTADRGVFTKYQALIFDEHFNVRHTLALGGIPSRTQGVTERPACGHHRLRVRPLVLGGVFFNAHDVDRYGLGRGGCRPRAVRRDARRQAVQGRGLQFLGRDVRRRLEHVLRHARDGQRATVDSRRRRLRDRPSCCAAASSVRRSRQTARAWPSSSGRR